MITLVGPEGIDVVIWFIGLSGSGKTTLSRALYDRVKPSHPSLVWLDGDILRDVFGNDAEHTVAGRRVNAERISNLCLMLDRQKIDVIAAVLSIFPDMQEWNREKFSDYFEIFLDVPVSVAEERDTKGLYAGATEGRIKNVVGIDIPFPRPRHPDLVISADEQTKGVIYCLDCICRALPWPGKA